MQLFALSTSREPKKTTRGKTYARTESEKDTPTTEDVRCRDNRRRICRTVRYLISLMTPFIHIPCRGTWC